MASKDNILGSSNLNLEALELKQSQDALLRTYQTLQPSPLLMQAYGSFGASAPTVSDAYYKADAVAPVSVLQHIAPVDSFFDNAVDAIDSLRQRLAARHPQSRDASLLDALEAYVADFFTGEEIRAAFAERPAELRQFFPYHVNDKGEFVRPSFEDATVLRNKVKEVAPASAGASAKTAHPYHTVLFFAGQAMLDDTRVVQRLRHSLVRIKRARLAELNRRRERLAELRRAISEARATLANLNRTRLEALGDYSLVQQLLSEDWAAVERRFNERARILNDHRGLFYARVRETPVSRTLPDPLALRHAAQGDLVPGCAAAVVNLPEEIEPFMEAVLDIPVADWNALREQYTLLPGRLRLDTLIARREARLKFRLNTPVGQTASRLGLQLTALRNQNQTLLRDLSRRSITPSVSLLDYQRRSRELLSLEDLLHGPPHRLRGAAQQLRDQLDQAVHCLLQQLRAVAPSIRLDWSGAAAADTLPTAQPERWPGLEHAERADFNGVRTLVELVAWWFRQLHGQAGTAAHTAMRNLVRACLMLAASDDPEELLHGRLQSVPGRLRLGEALRLELNREAVPGTLLRLLDVEQRVIGTLRVDDHDDQGAVATVTRIHDASALPDTRFTVTGYRSPLG